MRNLCNIFIQHCKLCSTGGILQNNIEIGKYVTEYNIHGIT